LRLNIESPLINETAVNFRLPSWPPPRDFPVVLDREGSVVSRYGDPVWDLSAWDRVPQVLNFGDGPLRKGTARISAVNADTLRIVAAWWLWGPRSVFTASTLVLQHQIFRNLFALCTSEGIDARELSRYPGVINALANRLPPARGEYALGLLYTLYEQRSQLGFTLLDAEGLRRLASSLPSPSAKEQTAYIPPRIWSYQINRLRAVLDDFDLYKDRIEACYQAALIAYASTYGSLLAARDSATRLKICGRRGASFEGLAKEYGIDQLLLRWYATKKHKSLPIFALSNFLTMVNRVGIAYLLNFSMMRIQEAWTLHIDCLHVERDQKLGEIAMLCGETTKTIANDDARWITSRSAKIAISALSTITRWRLKVRETYGDILPDGVPYLIQPACEPWAKVSQKPGRAGKVSYPSYLDVVLEHPKLFDPSELRVTEEDWRIAKLITPSLDEKLFGVGNIWSFGWHQLRRTGSVNMQASGIVSDFSIQYQLKHETLATSLYYGQGYSHLSFNRAARAEYIRTMYEMMGKELAQLFSDRFVSPYGAERKREILQIVSESDHKKLVSEAKAGRVAWRPTLLGGCTKIGPCEYGGVENIVRCGGGDNKAPCADALFDQQRLPLIQALRQRLAEQLENAESGSPYQLSLEAQRRAVENTLNVLNDQQ
jgi:hypothetical protein